MDIKDYINPYAEKTVLKIFFPGLLATWPMLLAAIKMIETDKQWIIIKNDSQTLNISIYIIFFISVYGIGHLLNKIAVRIEVELDTWYCKPTRKLYKHEKNRITENDFNKTWYSYLKKEIKNECTYPLINYYGNFITAYHFELTCLIAIPIQLFALFFDGYYTHLISPIGYIMITAISLICLIYLFWEARRAVGEAHNLRTKILELI